MVLAAPVNGLFPGILCFITLEKDIVYILTVNQSVIIRYVEVIRTFTPIFSLFYLYVSVQAKRALSHCYQNVQNVSKQPNNTKFSIFVLFNQIAYIVIKNKF